MIADACPGFSREGIPSIFEVLQATGLNVAILVKVDACPGFSREGIP